MHLITELGIQATEAQEKQILANIKKSLNNYQRGGMSKADESFLEGHKDFKYKKLYFNLLKSKSLYFELYPNMGIDSNVKYPNNKNLEWIIKFIFQDNKYPGEGRQAAEDLVNIILNDLGFSTEVLFETDKP